MKAVHRILPRVTEHLRAFAAAAALAATLLGLGVAGAEELRYVAIGDSITVVRATGIQSYVAQLQGLTRRLPFTGIEDAAEGGATTQIILDRWDTLVAGRFPAHVVSIMLGTNDHARQPTPTAPRGRPGQAQIHPRVPLQKYLANIKEMVRRLRAQTNLGTFNGGRPDIVLFAPPFIRSSDSDYGDPQSQARLELYADGLRSLAAELGVRFLNLNDITGRMVGWDEALWDTPEWTRDGVHPTTATHAKMLPYVREAIILKVR
jgi:lysophospholipase L1-like esterase